MKKAERSVCLRENGFGRPYADYGGKYGGKNGELMFQTLDQRVKQYIEENRN